MKRLGELEEYKVGGGESGDKFPLLGDFKGYCKGRYHENVFSVDYFLIILVMIFSSFPRI